MNLYRTIKIVTTKTVRLSILIYSSALKRRIAQHFLRDGATRLSGGRVGICGFFNNLPRSKTDFPCLYYGDERLWGAL